MTVIEKLKQLRTLMNERNMDVYMIPTSDFHETEYVGEHFKARSFMSGFTGSAGTLIVCRDCAALWTDGRYFIQAANQLKDSTIDLMKQGEEGVPEIPAYIREHMRENGVFGFDGRVMNTRLVHDYGGAEGQGCYYFRTGRPCRYDLEGPSAAAYEKRLLSGRGIQWKKHKG